MRNITIKTLKRICSISLLLLIMYMSMFFLVPDILNKPYSFAESVVFTAEEKKIIENSKSRPIKIGIIPNIYPLSACPPDENEFKGITVEMVKLISEKTGLQITFIRIPTDKMTPVEALKKGRVDLVAGTLKVDTFSKDKDLIMSDKLYDSSIAFILGEIDDIYSFKYLNPTIAILNNFTAGKEYIDKNFENYSLLECKNVPACLDAVATGKASCAVINRYAASYYLQPKNYKNLHFSEIFSVELESCIMGTDHNEALISIMNKGISMISEAEHNYVLMSISLEKQNMTFGKFVFQYRDAIVIVLIEIVLVIFLIFGVFYYIKIRKVFYYDEKTKLYSKNGFEIAVKRAIKNKKGKFFIVDFNMRNFAGFNTVYGRVEGDKLLKHIANNSLPYKNLTPLYSCRINADHFVSLVIARDIKVLCDDLIADRLTLHTHIPNVDIGFSIGIYPIYDKTIPVSTMIDYAVVARNESKNSSEAICGIFDDKVKEKLLKGDYIKSNFDNALETGDIFPVFRPQYNIKTNELIGATVSCNWRMSDGSLCTFEDYSDLLVENALLGSLKFYLLKRACQFQKNLMDSDMKPITFTLMFAGEHLYGKNYLEDVFDLIKNYNLDSTLFQLEFDEALFEGKEILVVSTMQGLKAGGVSVALTNFGMGYSSLNSMKDLSFDTLKLERNFLLAGMNNPRSEKILKTVINLAHELNITVATEGIETEEELVFIRSLKMLDLVQGSYLSQDMNEKTFMEYLKTRYNSEENTY